MSITSATPVIVTNILTALANENVKTTERNGKWFAFDGDSIEGVCQDAWTEITFDWGWVSSFLGY